MSNQSSLRTLKGTLRGDLIEPGDARYDEVRKVYNGMIDKRPLAIAMCLDVADVSAAVLAGADHGLPVAIRGGGHNAGGLGICNDGLVIDLSHMKQVEVDAAAKTVRVQRRRALARRRRRDARARPRGAGRHHLHHGRRRPQPRRRHRPSHSQVRPHHRQHRRRRDGARRRRDGDREQGAARRSVLGDPRRRRQLRHRHRVQVPRACDPHRHRRPDAVAARTIERDPAVVRGLPAEAARRAERVLRVPDGAAGTAVPRSAASQADVRHRLVLRRAARPGRQGLRANPRAEAGARPRRDRFRIPPCRACSIRCCLRACSGTGRPTS